MFASLIVRVHMRVCMWVPSLFQLCRDVVYCRRDVRCVCVCGISIQFLKSAIALCEPKCCIAYVRVSHL